LFGVVWGWWVWLLVGGGGGGGGVGLKYFKQRISNFTDK